jgi:ABC-type glycerol-3-phosphate transport system substrate-binding protein
MFPRISIAVMLTALLLPACSGSSGPGSGGTRYNPPNTQFATQLGIKPPPPVTQEQAMAIAAEAAGGNAVGVESESEGGQLLYEVKVETSSGRMEVEVRASDGGVVEIEPDDD